MFFATCLGTGALPDIINYGLARWVDGLQLRLLASSMSQVEQNLKKMTYSGDLSECTPENCMISVDSEDEIGEKALLQFFEHTDPASGLVLYKSGGELEIAASHGLQSPELVAVSDQVRIAVTILRNGINNRRDG